MHGSTIYHHRRDTRDADSKQPYAFTSQVLAGTFPTISSLIYIQMSIETLSPVWSMMLFRVIYADPRILYLMSLGVFLIVLYHTRTTLRAGFKALGLGMMLRNHSISCEWALKRIASKSNCHIHTYALKQMGSTIDARSP